MKILNKQLITVVLSLTFTSMAALAGDPSSYGYDPVPDTVSPSLNKNSQAAIISVPHATIIFPIGSSALSDTDKVALRGMFNGLPASAMAGPFVIAAWSDKSVPVRGHQLSLSDRKLAADRAMAIANFLRESGYSTAVYKSYNMAESTNWFAKNLTTPGDELQSAFSKKGARTPVTQSEFKVIQDEGGPTDAVVVIQQTMPVQ